MDMVFFRLYTGEKEGNAIKIKGLNSKVYTQKLDKPSFDKMMPFTVAYYLNEPNIEIPDFINVPPFILSDKYKDIFALLEPAIEFKGIQLYPDDKTQYAPMPTYWIPYLEKTDCLHKDSEIYDIGTAKKLILQKDAVIGKDIIRPAGIIEDVWLLSLTAAEAVLRRKPFGVNFEIIEVRE